MERGNNLQRKRRSDAGQTVFTSESKRRKVFRPVEYFKRGTRSENPGEIYSNEELLTLWSNLDEGTKKSCERRSERMYAQSTYLIPEIKRILKTTNGTITWRKMATMISGGDKNAKVVSHVTLMNFVMSLPDSDYVTTRILPLLNAQSVAKQLRWARGWFLFWYGAQSFAQKKQMLLVHMDEKWFFSLVARRHQKNVPFLGCTPKAHGVHHKNHIGKVLGLCTTGYMPINNNVLEGGQAIKIHIQRAGGLEKAKKDSY